MPVLSIKLENVLAVAGGGLSFQRATGSTCFLVLFRCLFARRLPWHGQAGIPGHQRPQSMEADAGEVPAAAVPASQPRAVCCPVSPFGSVWACCSWQAMNLLVQLRGAGASVPARGGAARARGAALFAGRLGRPSDANRVVADDWPVVGALDAGDGCVLVHLDGVPVAWPRVRQDAGEGWGCRGLTGVSGLGLPGGVRVRMRFRAWG